MGELYHHMKPSNHVNLKDFLAAVFEKWAEIEP